MRCKPMDISIVTPSYNMMDFLARCHASIKDQEGIDCEHLVIDGGSTDGTLEWLKNNDMITSISEKDKGMYDAINKGLLRAKGKIISYLNCDEQYLPGTLQFIKDYFENNPLIDVVFGNFLIIGRDGKLLSYRKAYQPRWMYIATSHLYVFSCTMFFRRKIIDDGLMFNGDLKTIGDGEFVIGLLRKGYRASYVNRYLAAFTLTGSNMLAGDNAKVEVKKAWKQSPIWLKTLKYPLTILRLMEKALSGAYYQKMPINYAIFMDDLEHRQLFSASSASPRWPI